MTFIYPPVPVSLSGGATEATLLDVEQNTADTVTELQTANTSLNNIEADVDELNARLAGSLVPEQFDYIALTYVTVGNGIGEIETVVYKLGGAGGSTVATLTLAYDGSDKLSSVTRS